jgi:hypothetical protein
LPPEYRTATTPPLLEIVRVSESLWADGPDLDGAGGLGAVAFFDVVVVVEDDDVEDDEPLADAFPSDFDFVFSALAGAAVVVVVDSGGAVLVVDEAGDAASVNVSAVAPGRGSVLAGGAGAEDDVAPAEGLAGSASTAGA